MSDIKIGPENFRPKSTKINPKKYLLTINKRIKSSIGKKPHLFKTIATVIVLFLVLIVTLAIVIKPYDFVDVDTNDTANNQKTESTGYRFGSNQALRFDGSNLYLGEELIINNINGVDKVRFGPDGKTIHFDMADVMFTTNCIDLNGLIEPQNNSYRSISPKENVDDTPWEFSTLGHGNVNNVNWCGWLKGGYVYKHNLFVYLKHNKSETPILIIETIADNGTTVKTVDIPIDNIPYDFFENNKYGYNSYEVKAIEGIDNSIYYYPKINSKIVNNNLIVPMGNIIIVINLENQNLVGIINLNNSEYDVVSDSYYIITNETPAAYIESSWEGCHNPTILIDLSKSGKMKIIDLKSLKEKSYCSVPNAGFVSSNDSNIIFNLYSQPSVEHLIDVDYEEVNKLGNKDLKENEERRIENKIRSNFNVSYVKCEFGYGVGMGCHILSTPKQYTYNSDGVLSELK